MKVVNYFIQWIHKVLDIDVARIGGNILLLNLSYFLSWFIKCVTYAMIPKFM